MTIDSEISRLQTAKADIKTSIEGKGVSIGSDIKIDDYSDYIDQIEGYEGPYVSEYDYSAMRGPCPEGFHIPTREELSNLYNQGITLGTRTSSSGSGMKTYLKMPYGGRRNSYNGNAEFQGTSGNYISCNRYNNKCIYCRFISDTYNKESTASSTCSGQFIRPFKDESIIPTNSWTALYEGDAYGDGTYWYTPGIFWNSTLGLISISSNGKTSDPSVWITISDKNLGATTVYNDGDTLSEANCGKYYQWGNDYGFPRTGTVSTSTTQVDGYPYGPYNHYSSSTFIYDPNILKSRDKDSNYNLRGGCVGKRIKKKYITTSNGTYEAPAIGQVTNISQTESGGFFLEIEFKNPEDIIVNGVTAVKRIKTIVRRDASSTPTSSTSGTAVAEFVRSSSLVPGSITVFTDDSSLTSNKMYYYGIFTIGDNGVETLTSFQGKTS